MNDRAFAGTGSSSAINSSGGDSSQNRSLVEIGHDSSSSQNVAGDGESGDGVLTAKVPSPMVSNDDIVHDMSASPNAMEQHEHDARTVDDSGISSIPEHPTNPIGDLIQHRLSTPPISGNNHPLKFPITLDAASFSAKPPLAPQATGSVGPSVAGGGLNGSRFGIPSHRSRAGGVPSSDHEMTDSEDIIFRTPVQQQQQQRPASSPSSSMMKRNRSPSTVNTAHLRSVTRRSSLLVCVTHPMLSMGARQYKQKRKICIAEKNAFCELIRIRYIERWRRIDVPLVLYIRGLGKLSSNALLSPFVLRFFVIRLTNNSSTDYIYSAKDKKPQSHLVPA